MTVGRAIPVFEAGGMSAYVEFFGSRDLPPRLRAVLALLAELSCPPWKFDVLWQAWPEIRLGPDDFPTVAAQLLDAASPAELPFGACVFDDLTIYWDVVDRAGPPYPHGRDAYRNAYLALRPMLFRLAVDEPPTLGTPDEEAYLLRLALVSVLAGSDGTGPTVRVLEECALRYEQRGRADGALLARQNADLLQRLADLDVPSGGATPFAQEALQLMFRAEERAVAFEIALQWWPVYGGRIWDGFRVKSDRPVPGEDPADTAMRGEMRAVFGRIEPFAWLSGQRPGVGPAVIALALMRTAGRQLPPSAALFPPDWVDRCANDLAWLRGHYATTTDLGFDEVLDLEAALTATRGPAAEPARDVGPAPVAEPPAEAHDLAPDEARAAVMELNRRGMELNRLGEFGEARQLGEQALAIATAAVGADTPHYAASLNTVATALENSGDLIAARGLFEQAASVMADALGEDSPDHGVALNNLANVELGLGRHDRAAELFDRALGIATRAHGPESPLLVPSINNLAHLRLALGDTEGAEELLERGLRIRRASLGDRHPETGRSLSHLARLYVETGRVEGAVSLLEEAVAIWAGSLGEEHPYTLDSLEDLARLQADLARYEAAEATYRRLLNRIIRSSDDEDRRYLTALVELGWVLLWNGRYATAREAVREASGLLVALDGADAPGLAGLLRLQGQIDLRDGRFEPATTAFERAYEIDTRAGADQGDVGVDLVGIGDALRAAGDDAGAERPLREGVTILDGAPGTSAGTRATVRNNLAELYRAMGRLDEAEPLYRQALELAEESWPDGHPDRAAILNNLALLHRQRGTYRTAVPLLERAVSDLRGTLGPSHPTYAATLANLGGVRLALGDFAAAEELLTEALEIRRRAFGQAHVDVALSLDALGTLYARRGRLDLSEPLAREALEVYRITFGDQHPEVAVSLHNLAAKYMKSGLSGVAAALLAEAEPALNAALSAERPHPRWANVLLLWAEIFLSAGNTGAAEPLVHQALQVQQGTLGADHPELVDGLWLLAGLHAVAGRRAEAFATAARVSSITDRIVEDVFATTSEAQRLAFAATIGRDIDLTLSLVLWFTDRTDPDDTGLDEVRAAVDLVLRRKAITAEILGRQRDLVSTEYPELAVTMSELRTLRAQIAQHTLDGPGTDDVAEYARRLAEWQRQRTGLESELARMVPVFDRDGGRPRPSHRSVAAALPDGWSLGEFVRFARHSFGTGERPPAEERYAALVVTQSGTPTVLDMGAAGRLEDLVARFRRTVAVAPGGRTAADDNSGRQLRETLLNPVLAAAQTQRVLLAPDGDLHLLPFAALPADDGRPAADLCDISYLGCGRDLLPRNPGGSAAGPPLVVADPAYNLSVPDDDPWTSSEDPPGRRSQDLDRSLRFWRLRGTREEGERIAQMLGVRPLLGEDACDATVKSARSPRIVHLATHGFFIADQEQPDLSVSTDRGRLDGARLENPLLRSGLALAGANIWLRGGQTPPAAEDGLLTAEDITGMDLSGTELVVLSACETGLGEIHAGEGVFGLQRAVTLAGARRLVMSLWKVADAQTQTLMVLMYERLMGGGTVPDALRHAQEQLRRTNPDPYYWAGFVALGDPAPLAS